MLALTESSPKTLRDDQADAIERLRQAAREGKRRIVCQAPTGWGKTLVASFISDSVLRKKGKLLFTVPAISLVDQTVEVLASQGIKEVGVIQQKHHLTNWSQPVQVASVQTLMRRGLPQGITVAMVDECHVLFSWYTNHWFFEEAWKNIPIIGLSATPWTKGLGRLYQGLVIVGTTQQMIDRGVLSKFKAFAPSHPDLEGVRTVAGDFHEGELSQAMSKPGIVGDVIATWNEKARGLPTLLFAVDRAHAKHLQEKFLAAGVPAAYQDAKTPDRERAQIKDDFHSGRVSVVCSVGTLIVGIDWDVRCMVFARPTKSEMLWVQAYGRGLRVAPGKEFCLVLDHADNHTRLGFPTEIVHEALDDGKKKEANGVKNPALPAVCPQCAFLMPPRIITCPSCGFTRKAVSHVVEKEGELKEIMPRGTREAAVLRTMDRRSVWAQLSYIRMQRNYAAGWIAHKYKEIFGCWPVGVQGEMQKPGREMVAWWRTQGGFWKMVNERNAKRWG
jgi:superfamily II DNA or RNA helicase